MLSDTFRRYSVGETDARDVAVHSPALVRVLTKFRSRARVTWLSGTSGAAAVGVGRQAGVHPARLRHRVT